MLAKRHDLNVLSVPDTSADVVIAGRSFPAEPVAQTPLLGLRSVQAQAADATPASALLDC
jgi:hypothetical protein